MLLRIYASLSSYSLAHCCYVLSRAAALHPVLPYNPPPPELQRCTLCCRPPPNTHTHRMLLYAAPLPPIPPASCPAPPAPPRCTTMYCTTCTPPLHRNVLHRTALYIGPCMSLRSYPAFCAGPCTLARHRCGIGAPCAGNGAFKARCSLGVFRCSRS
eukprot:362057-Chlamydomonas_euryale.AAC.18